MQALQLQVDEVKERWANREYFKVLDSQSLISQADALGRVTAYRALIEMDATDLTNALELGEPA